MYIDFYGLINEPFRTTPDADAIFLSPSHRQALESILYGIKERKGIILVTGEVGVGKTTVLCRYLQIAVPNDGSTPQSQRTAHLYNPNVTFAHLLAMILHQLGAEPLGNDAAEMVGQLHELAKEEHGHGGTVVIVIDEAQCMPVETLEGIRMLTNLETANEKLIQIVLVGQPELETLLEHRELRHVRERIAVRGKILPLTKRESFAYIHHRLDQASGKQVAIFSTAALGVIIKAAKGIPRRLNILCDNALMTGFRHREAIVSGKIAKHVVAEIEGPQSSALRGRRRTAALVAGIALALPVFVYFGSRTEIPWDSLSIVAQDGNPSILDPAGPSGKSPTPWSGRQIAAPAPVNAALIGPQETFQQGKRTKEPVAADLRRTAINETPLGSSGSDRAQEKEPVQASVVVRENGSMKIVMAGEPAGSEEADASETARLLAVMLDSGRVVLGKAQSAINNPRLEDKGFSSSIFEARLRKEFLARTGHDLQNLKPAALPERAKPLLIRLASYMQKMVKDAQPEINKKGVGFKGFIPATFATKVADQFSKETGLKLRQIGPPEVEPRNPENKPDAQEELALLAIQKSHPRVGDHVIEQRLADKSVRVLLPLFYTKACLACHGKPKGEIDISGYEKEGFKEGDLGGAISVILPSGVSSPDGEREG